MNITLWDGESDVAGIPAQHLRDAYPLPAGGKLALVWNEHGGLAQVQDVLPIGGRIAITEDNLAQLEEILTAQQNPTPATPPTDTVSREEYDALRADLDWVINFSVTGEA